MALTEPDDIYENPEQPKQAVSTAGREIGAPGSILDPGFNLTLRPMQYPVFYDMYRDAIKNTWTVEEIDFSDDVVDLDRNLLPAERHLINRLVAFFATGDSIVANNLVLNLYQHINSPEARMYLSRQLYEEALHVQFYLTLLDNYIPDVEERAEAFAAIENIPSIRRKAEFCFKWMSSINDVAELRSREERQQFLLNLICFAACIEGLFFFAAFAYVYFLRSKGLLNGLAAGTNWVFRDESCHMNFAFEVVNTIRNEEPDLFDDDLSNRIVEMLEEAIEVESQFAADVLGKIFSPDELGFGHLAHFQPHGSGHFRLVGGDQAVHQHTSDDPIAAFLGGGGILDRMIIIGSLGQGGEIGGLGGGQFVQGLVEIVQRRRRNAVGTEAQINLV